MYGGSDNTSLGETIPLRVSSIKSRKCGPTVGNCRWPARYELCQLENGEVMRKYQKAAVAVAMLGSVGMLGAGVGHAADGDPKVKLDNKQNQKCSADERNGGLITIGDINLALN